MNNICDQTTDRVSSFAERQKPDPDAFLSPDENDKRTLNGQSHPQDFYTCTDHSAPGFDQALAAGKSAVIPQAANEHPAIDSSEWSEHVSTGHLETAKMSVDDSDESPRASSPESDDLPSPGGSDQAATGISRSLSDEALDGPTGLRFSVRACLDGDRGKDPKDLSTLTTESSFNDGSSSKLNDRGSILLDLPTDHPRSVQHAPDQAQWPIRLLKQLAPSLKTLAHEHDVDLPVVLLSAWSAVLSRLSGQHELDIALQGFASNRQIRSEDSSAFLSLHIDLSGDLTTVQLLEHVKRVIDSTAHRPLRQKDVAVPHQVTFRWYDQGQGSSVVGFGQPSSNAVVPVGFELELHLQDVDDQIVGAMHYVSALFNSTTIERHVGYLDLMLKGMASNAMESVTKINIISPAEQTLLLDSWSKMLLSQQGPQTIHQLFEEQVKRTPEAIALAHEDQELRYAELNAGANSLAHRLIELGVRPDTCVGICAARSIAMITGMLAIMKAGGAYVPLDPTYPSERLKSILSDAAPSIMVADETGRAALCAALDEATLFSLTLVDPETSFTHQTTNPQVYELTERHLAYVIYTSGSTGKPKGVMIEHRGVANLLQYVSELYGVGELSRTIQFASISFDVAVWEIFLAITSGATLYLPPDSIRLNRDKLWDYMIQHSITYATFTPSFLQDGKDLPTSTKPLTLVLGGEALSPTLLRNLIRQGITVFNEYGPTEASISAAAWKCPTYYDGGVVPIGRPTSNVRLYILDTQHQPVPLGTVGELYIGGEGVARGYLNRPEQTAERFLMDPFSDHEGARMYRSGDLVRYLQDGNLVYLGRSDDQVKIRGFRIELGEIETCLLEHEWVSEAVVLALDAGDNKRLVAYVVSEPHDQLPHHLRTHVVAKLPPYMVPAAYVRLNAMPLTANDKLDRTAMPAPDEDCFAREAYEDPRGDIEIKLAAIWSQLLRIKRISRRDSFFALGGHSLLAAKMLEHLRRDGLTVSVRALFECPTLSTLARAIGAHEAISIPPNVITQKSKVLTPEMLPLIDLNQGDIDHIVRCVPGGLSNIQDIYSLSPLQDGILFHHLLATEGDPYLVTSTMAFESRTLLDRYLDAFQMVVDRHDILRTVFFWENLSNSAQVVCRSAPLPILELSLDPGDGPIVEQLDRLFNPKHYRIDLCQVPLLRFMVAKDAKGRWLLVQLIHHLIGDHTSAEEMHIEVKALLDGQSESLPAPRPFRDLLAQARLKSCPKAHEQFFKDMLAAVDESTLPFGLTAVNDGGAEVTESHQILSQDLNDRLRLQAKGLRVGLASVCHVAWAQILARTSGQQSVVFGTVLFGRLQDEDSSGHALGLSINTLPFRCDIDKRSARECVQDTHVRLTALLEHEHASLALAQRCSGIPIGTPLFSALLNYRHTSLSSSSCSSASKSEFVSEEERLHYPGVKFVSGQERSNYPFGLSVEDFGTALGLTAQVMHPIEPGRVCAYMKQALESLVEALETASDAPIQRLEVLPEVERELLFRTWNSIREDYPNQLCLHQLFEQQVEHTPEAIAVVHEGQSLTYAELNARANSLAHQLIQLGVQPDALVAICVERSPAMIIGILAILKAGGAYVPLDPFFASDRLRDVLHDTSPICLIADNAGRSAVGEAILSTVIVVDPTIVEAHPKTNPQISTLTSRHLAYIIFTSGTTGKPKGVMIEHQGVVNLVTSEQEYLLVQPSSRTSQFFSISFDGSVCEIFCTLSFGGCLHLLPKDIRLDLNRMWSYLQQHRITHAMLTPTVLQGCEDLTPLSTMSKLIIAAEPLSVALARKVCTLMPSGTIINEYGPTETAVTATAWKFSEDGLNDMAPIGRPLPNKRVYLLDKHGNPVPLGTIGEIYIGGVGVARGYLNRSDLTAERFLPDPFSRETEGRMYKTGDLARYLPDGNLVCLGRNDHQVKIRGFRVELGEIEARLTEHSFVSEAVVVTLGEGSGKRLVAYVIVHPDHGVAQASDETRLAMTLRSHLATQLPEYMVPAAFVCLDTFPLTPNGKLDRRALPAPGDDDFARESYEAPQGEAETNLAAIWSDLLRVDRVSRHDNFFALGGHSLLAVQMISRLRRLGYSVSVRTLFAFPILSVLAQSVGQLHDIVTPPNLIAPGLARITPGMLPLIDLDQMEIDHIVERIPGGVANIQDIYALSPLQDGILFHHLMAKSIDPYVLYVSMAFGDRESLDGYLATIQQIVNRHDILRTSFLWENLSTPVQVVWRDAQLSITELELDPADGSIAQQLKQKFDSIHYHMDLTRAPLIHFVIAQERDGRWILIELLHHLIGDHSTLEVMESEIQALSEGLGSTLPPAQPYRNLIAQARLGMSQEAHERFFKEMLVEIDTPSLPFGIANIHGDGTKVVESYRMLSQDLNSRLRSQAKRLGVSLASLCHVAWGQVIGRTSGQQRVVFGTVLLGRMQGSTSSDQAMGLFVNSLPFRVDLDRGSVEESVRETHARLAALMEHEHASLALAQRCSSVAPGVPLFSSLLNYRHNSPTSDDDTGAYGRKVLEFQERTNYPVGLSIEDYGTSLGLTVKIVQPLDSDRVCGYMQKALESLASALEHNPSLLVAQLEVLPTEEGQLLLHEWNMTQKEFPDHLCLHRLFEQQVELTPEATAVAHEDQFLSYEQLNARANNLAYRLIELGVRPDSLVAICVERSPAMIIGILAILKAGGAYVPLDPFFASDRLRDILNDVAPSILIADRVGREALGKSAFATLAVVDPNSDEQSVISNPQVAGLSSRNLAYVIYTSGSTGKPKGVMIEHQGAVNLVYDRPELFDIHPDSRVLQNTSLSFDHSVSEIFSTLRCGASLYLVRDDTRLDRHQLWDHLARNSITHVSFTPTLLHDCKDLTALGELRVLIVMGEAVPPKLPGILRTIVPNGIIINSYGPTECSVSTTVWKCTSESIDDKIPIGRPLSNKTIYLLDNHGNTVPLGAIGEMYIGGVGVARGYLNRSDLTAERFLPDAFTTKPGARMYRTGDLARYLPDGNLVCLGRNDNQIKIRGFRIELGEIEARLIEHPSVSEAVVVTLGEATNMRLVAYTVASPDGNLALALRSYLSTRLPDYMVPAAFVRMDSFPLTSNGKLDRRALPSAGDDDFARQVYEAPQGKVENALASIWADLLHLERISRHDSFFALGGHSLLAVQVISRLHRLGYSISVRKLFESPTLSVLAQSADQCRDITTPPNLITPCTTRITPELLPLIDLSQKDIDHIVERVPGGVANVQDIYALSPQQDGILFHHLMAKTGDPYVLYTSMSFDNRTSLDQYLATMQQIVNRHDILRTAFAWENLTMPAQVVWRNAPLPIAELKLDPANGPVTEQLKRMFDPLSHRVDLMQAPLIRFAVAQEHGGSWIVVELLHHLIGDHSTFDFMDLELQALMEGQGLALPPSQPYRNLIAQVRFDSSQDHHERFFREMLEEIDTPSLPFGMANVLGDGSMISVSERMLSHDLNNRLRSQAKRLGISLASLCHVAWAQVIGRTSGQQLVVFGTVLLGRMQGATGSDRAMGLFVNSLPFRVDLDRGSIEESVRETHARLAALLEHEHASLALAQRCSSVVQGVPLFNSLLNYRHNSPTSDDDTGAYGMKVLDSQERTNYPISLSVEDNVSSLGLTAQVAQLLDSDRICGYMQEALESLASALEHNPSMSALQLVIMPIEERQMLLHDWNTTQEYFPDQLCLHQLFEKQVARSPEAVAIVCEDRFLTYTELNSRANRLAHQLIEHGVQPDSLVAICVERSLAMVTAVLATLKAGGAYVPLDPAYPSDRLLTILSDSSPSVVLADSVGKTVLGESCLSTFTTIDPNLSFSEEANINPDVPGLTPHNLAYVIYTSGSTGKPKGVMVEHRMIARAFDATAAWFHFSERDTWSMFHSFAFDVSVWEMWGALRYGGKLVLVPQHITRSPEDFYRLLCDQAVTVLNQTPSAFSSLIDYQAYSNISDNLRYVILAGEALAPAMLEPWYARHDELSSRVVNMYGPTETFYTTYRPMTPEDCNQTASPIGVRFPDLRFYVLDAYGQPVPLGVIGELYIGGAGVARGYLNRADLTAEKFLLDPFAGGAAARMYKTGDLVRYLADGNLVFLGRNDDQVKIHGFRIELGEIEARLVEHPLVRDAAVIALKIENDKRIVAYVVAKPEERLALTLWSHLATRLPMHMVPAAFVQLESFPLTPNGKLDRRALPAPGPDDFARQLYEAPQGEIEKALSAMWTELLHVEQVSRHDNFFALGGHSLLAVRLMNRVITLGAHIPLSSLFSSPHLSGFAAVVAEQIDQGSKLAPIITPLSRDDALPLSFAQQRLWFLVQLQEASGTYHIPLAVRMRGDLDYSAFKKALNGLFVRHEALRSVFVNISGQPEVHILPAEGMPLRYVDLRSMDDADVQLARLAKEEAQASFDLAQGPLIRALLIQLQDDEHVLVITQHHIVSDGWSLSIMLRELSQLYTAYFKGESSPLSPLAIQYPDYAAWERQWFTEDRLMTQSDYWRKTLSDAPTMIDLPTDRPRPPQQSFKGDHVSIFLDPQMTSALKQLCQQHGVTLFMTILSAWSVVLSRLSGQDDIVIGTPSANRSRQEIEPLIGFFVNTLAMRIDLSGEPSTRDLLERVRRGTLAAYSHQDLPFEQVIEFVQPPRKMNHTPLFQVMFVWQNNEDGELDLPGLQVTPYDLDHDEAKFDLTLALWESDNGITGRLGYATSLFDRTTIEKHIGYLCVMLQAMATDAERPIAAVDILSPSELALLVHTWNETQEDYPDQLCLHQLFEQQVVHTPEAIAVVHEGQSLTYAELNARANSLAHQLIQLGVQPNALVAVCVARSPAMIIGILAILKAGGAYVPLDPFFASDRLRDVLHDTSPVCLIADNTGRSAVGEALLSTVIVVDPTIVEAHPKTDPQISTLTSRHLAYIIFTSGTTGKPKGVMIEHQGAVNLISSRQKYLRVQLSSRISQFFSISFDSSVCEIFGALAFGGCLHLLHEDIRLDRHRMWSYLQQHRITHALLTPTVLQDCEDLSPLSTMSKLIVAAESLSAALVRKVHRLVPHGTIINEYGPTETVVAATAWIFSENGLNDMAPIGRPLPNKRVYLLDKHGNPVPLGAIGEIYIGGVGVARGYLNRSDLTAERFLPDPFSRETEGRMYKTGDLARYLPDGNLVCLGRNDHQVKIRGFRVELGEIEARLTEHSLVSEAVVVALGEGSGKRLVAYVIVHPDHGSAQAPDETRLAMTLRSHLSTQLPEYMVPAAFVRLDAFPLTPNGKLDRRALPAPGDDDFARESYEAPQGEVETALAAIWSDLLRVDRVSRHDNFFSLGGHSLLAVRLMNRVAALGASLQLNKLFALPCLSDFAAVVSEHLSQGGTVAPPITPVHRDNTLPLSFAQQRLWFLAQLQGASGTYHVPLAVRLRGVSSWSAWKRALEDLYARHETLRSVFVNISGKLQVRILKPEGVPFRNIDLRGNDDSEVQSAQLTAEEARTPFDLAKGPLIRALMIQLQDDEHVLLITQHHIVSDGWSLAITLRELSQFYTAHCNGESNPLPPLAIQYPDYAVWQRQWLSGDRLMTQSDYWRKTLSDAPTMIDLPTDRPRPPQQSVKGDHVSIFLDPQMTSALKQLCQQHGVTLFMTILSAWSVVLSRLSGQDDIVIGTPSANRSRQEIEPLIGFFVNTLAMRIDLSGEPSTRDLLERVRRSTLAAYSHQDLPFEQVIEFVQPPRKMNHTPLFQVMFVWQNNEDGELDLPGLQVTPYDLDHDEAKFDLTLALWESDNGITGRLGYATSLFDRTTIEKHIGYLCVMLQAMATDAERPIAAVDILSPSELALLVHTWNETQEDYPDQLCLHQLFEQQVELTPEATAVAHEDQFLSYEQLNARANNLAYRLIELGVRPDSPVAICVERSPAMIIGILAILKAGGTYVPLDPFFASDRLRDILNDVAPSILIADRVGREALGKSAFATLAVVDPNSDEQGVISNPQVAGLSSRNLAYVIYTSGSTGKPKGVMIEHQGAVNLVYGRPELVDIHPDSRVLQNTSLSFDHSVSEIFSTLRCGASLYLVRDDTRLDRHQLWDYLARNSITHVSFTPTLLHDCKDLTALGELRVLIVMGEAVPPKLPGILRTIVPNGIIINGYGPTECSVATTMWKCTSEPIDDRISIGRPLPNKRVYLLDKHGNPVPLGAIGEIYIGGVGVARGYLNRSDLTAERFLPDPFSRETEGRMYKTGDLARYLPDGNLVCLGRNDHQVKIRGFRVELGEIEARLTEHSFVSEAVVVALGEGSGKRLVAYVIVHPDHGSAAQASDETRLAMTLRSHLATQLPEYMVPAAFVRLDAFPLTPNGKLDRNALPAPQDHDFALQVYEEPKGEIEIILSTIWTELLNIERVGRNDGFFILGGHSLMAIRMVSRIRTMLGFEMSLRTLFEAPTIAELAPRLLATGATQEESFDVLLPIKPKGNRPPLFCVHPGTGLSWCFSGLSTRLDPDQPLYGLQARGFIEGGKMASTLDEMVLDYLNQVRLIQPRGPYHLLGYSFGGLVAHTMASYLEKQGERVSLVALMDTPADYHSRVQRTPASEDEKEPDLIQMLVGNRELYSPDLINPYLEKMPVIGKNNHRIGRLQAPDVFGGDLLIFHATDTQKGTEPLCPDDWKPYVLGTIEVHDIDCQHDFMDMPKPTAEMGRILSQKLDESHRRAQKEA